MGCKLCYKHGVTLSLQKHHTIGSKLVEQTPFGIISNDAKIKDFPTRQRLLIFSCSAV
jgi:hypothetical protein